MSKKYRNILLAIFILLLIIVAALIYFFKSNNHPNYLITFDTDGGSNVEQQLIKEGSVVTKPHNPEKDGYTFIEWTLNGVTFDFNTIVDKDITLVATWKEKDKDSFTIRFDTDGGTLIDDIIIKKGDKLLLPENPIWDGHKFIEWQLDGNTFDIESEITSDIKLVAKWEEEKTKEEDKKMPQQENKKDNQTNSQQEKKQNESSEKKVNKYTVTFNSNGGSTVSSQTITEGSKASKPSNPTKSGYTFGGWTLNGQTYDFNTPVSGNITLVATWNAKSYTVKVSAVDDYSPARILSVYENDTKITVKEIKYSDGTYLCSGSNSNVNKNVIVGETTFIVVLNDGTQVSALVS